MRLDMRLDVRIGQCLFGEIPLLELLIREQKIRYLQVRIDIQQGDALRANNERGHEGV